MQFCLEIAGNKLINRRLASEKAGERRACLIDKVIPDEMNFVLLVLENVTLLLSTGDERNLETDTNFETIQAVDPYAFLFPFTFASQFH